MYLYFNMSSFSFYYSLESSSETLNWNTEFFLWYFDPGFLQKHLQTFNGVACFSIASNINQILKSRGFKSGEVWGHISLLQKFRKLALHHTWVFLDVWEEALSCWKVKFSFLKSFFIAWDVGIKIFSIYAFVFSFMPCLMKMRGDFHILEIAAQTMTEAGFCQQ